MKKKEEINQSLKNQAVERERERGLTIDDILNISGHGGREVNDKDDVDDGAGVGAGVVALWRTTVGPCRECRADQDESYNKHLQDLTMVFFFHFIFRY